MKGEVQMKELFHNRRFVLLLSAIVMLVILGGVIFQATHFGNAEGQDSQQINQSVEKTDALPGDRPPMMDDQGGPPDAQPQGNGNLPQNGQ